MRILLWALRAVLFFVLFAFALNNQHEAVLKGFFGAAWHTPMVVVVLVSFACGAVFALVSLAPRLWRRPPPPTRPTEQEPGTTAADRPARPVGTTQGDTAPAPLDEPVRDGV